MDGARSNVEVVDVGEQVTDRTTVRGRGGEVGDRLSCVRARRARAERVKYSITHSHSLMSSKRKRKDSSTSSSRRMSSSTNTRNATII